MQDGLTAFFHMGGYGFYVWMSYGIVFVVLAANVWWPMRSARALRARLARQRRFEEADDHDA